MGFAIRGRQAIFGYDAITAYKKKQVLVVVCNTMPEKSLVKLTQFCQNNIALVKVTNLTLGEYVGRDNVKAISVTNTELAKAIFQIAEDGNGLEIIKRGSF